MPPIRMTGAINAMTSEKSKYQSAASKAANATSVATLADTPNCVMTQMVSGNASTTATSSDAPASRFQLKGTSPPQLFLRAKYATVNIIISVSTTPGTTPARNNDPIDTLAIM